VTEPILSHTFANGLVLLAEPMMSLESAAFTFLVPAGSVYDQPGQNGTASILSDLITRGAGNYSSKQLSAALDNLGVQRHESVSSGHMAFGGATLAESLPETLRIYGDILRRPLLPADQFDAAAAGVEQSLRSIEDEPRQKVMLELRRRCYPDPWGRPTEGALEDLPNITADVVRDHYEHCFRPNETILGVAGNVRMADVRPLVEEIFGDWEQRQPPRIDLGPRGPYRDHIAHASTQTQIGVAYGSVP
jgi:predicted Zn-dependent peptidase